MGCGRFRTIITPQIQTLKCVHTHTVMNNIALSKGFSNTHIHTRVCIPLIPGHLLKIQQVCPGSWLPRSTSAVWTANQNTSDKSVPTSSLAQVHEADIFSQLTVTSVCVNDLAPSNCFVGLNLVQNTLSQTILFVCICVSFYGVESNHAVVLVASVTLVRVQTYKLSMWCLHACVRNVTLTQKPDSIGQRFDSVWAAFASLFWGRLHACMIRT